MPPRRILVLHSYAHEGMEQRSRRADANPALRNIKFRHIAVIDEDSKLFKRMEARISAQLNRRSAGLSTDADIYRIQRDGIGKMVRGEATPSVLAQIEKINPDVLVIHGGTAFRSATERFIQMLIYIRKKYPDLPFALEGKSEWLQWLLGTRAREYYGTDYEIITNQIGWATTHFIDDAEIDKIIDELF